MAGRAAGVPSAVGLHWRPPRARAGAACAGPPGRMQACWPEPGWKAFCQSHEYARAGAPKRGGPWARAPAADRRPPAPRCARQPAPRDITQRPRRRHRAQTAAWRAAAAPCSQRPARAGPRAGAPPGRSASQRPRGAFAACASAIQRRTGQLVWSRPWAPARATSTAYSHACPGRRRQGAARGAFVRMGLG